MKNYILIIKTILGEFTYSFHDLIDAKICMETLAKYYEEIQDKASLYVIHASTHKTLLEMEVK